MKNFLIIISIFFCLNINSQELDLGYLKITYKLNFITDTTNLQEYKTDNMLLILGKNISAFYSYNQFIADSLLEADEKNGVSPVDMLANLKRYKGSKNSYTIYKNYPTGKITTFDKIASDKYKYEEFLEVPDWKISKEKGKILNFTCQKATSFYLGRYYEAWFTTEIALSNGPWKFTGLPGLILKINDFKNHYIFECIGIEKLGTHKPITLPNGDFISVSKKDFQKIQKRYMSDPIEYLKSTTGAEIEVDGGNKKVSKPFNPIEL